MGKRKRFLNNKGDSLITALISSLILGIVSLGLVYGFFMASRTNTIGAYIERSSLIAQYVMERISSLPPDDPQMKNLGVYGDPLDPSSNSAINNLIPHLTDDIAQRFPFYRNKDGSVNYGIQVQVSNPVGTLDSNVTGNLRVITIAVEPSNRIKGYIFGGKGQATSVGDMVLGSISRTLKYVE